MDEQTLAKSDATKAVLRLIRLERERQDVLYGDQSGRGLLEWNAILGEEYGELCEAISETALTNTRHPERGGWDNVRKEAIHVAAVATHIAERAMEEGRV